MTVYVCSYKTHDAEAAPQGEVTVISSNVNWNDDENIA